MTAHVIGLTGGIASGKSTVARLLAERGAAIVDADQIAREVVEPGKPALAEIVAEFNRRNAPIKLVVVDPALSYLQLSATLRSDNIEGFVRFLESGFGVRADRAGKTIRFRKAPVTAPLK